MWRVVGTFAGLFASCLVRRGLAGAAFLPLTGVPPSCAARALRLCYLARAPKCVARKTRCTFVKFHRQTAPVGPGHPSSLSASSLPSHPSLPPSLPPLSASALSHPLPPLSHGMMGGVGGGGGGGMHPTLSLDAPPGQPFLYAQQQGAGGYVAFPSAGAGGGSPTFAGEYARRDAEYPGRGEGEYAHERGEYGVREGGGGRRGESPTFAGYHELEMAMGGVGGQRKGSVPAGWREGSAGAPSYYPGPSNYYTGEYRGGAEFDSQSSHSGHSGGSASRPTSSAGGGDYSPYLPNGRHHASASLDLHDLQHPHDLQRPPEFSSAFGLMSLDDPNVLAGLAPDGVPFFSHAHAHAQTQTAHGQRPQSSHGGAGGGGGEKRMQLVPPLAYQPYGSTPGAAQTPGTREAETRELREFWKAYMRTPLTGPTPTAGAETGGLGLATPMAGPGAGGRRYRVASLPSVKTPEGEGDPGGYPGHAPAHGAQGAQGGQAGGGGGQGRTMHNADDLRSYEAAVLARKAPELVLRKPARRPTTSAGPAPPPSQPPQQQAPFEFGGREAAHEFGVGVSREPSQSQSSLAGAFGFAGAGYAAPPPAGGSVPNSPFPGTPTSASASASASASDGEDGEGSAGRPSFKRLPSQTLGPPQAKRRRDRPGMITLGGLPPSGMGMPAGEGGGGAGGGRGGGAGELPSVNAYPERPMIALRAPPAHAHGGHPHRRARRLSAPASPTAPVFVVD
ncbi:hypothetical protein FB451DRAFT_1182632 [Mycena latifolia]|nr:hypothetical protein FB451DRAFT_1182632 [Mycena latifolia]